MGKSALRQIALGGICRENQPLFTSVWSHVLLAVEFFMNQAAINPLPVPTPYHPLWADSTEWEIMLQGSGI